MFGQSKNIQATMAVALIRQRMCAGWSEPLLVAYTTLLEISLRNTCMPLILYRQSYFEFADILGSFKSRQFLGVTALITKACRSADSNQFSSVEASCSESTLHHIFRFRTKDKEVKKSLYSHCLF